jgi:hypothetical protein
LPEPLNEFCQAEIKYVWLATFVHEDIGEFEVPMDYSLLMGVRDG